MVTNEELAERQDQMLRRLQKGQEELKRSLDHIESMQKRILRGLILLENTQKQRFS